MDATPIEPFDICGPLPGTSRHAEITLLEASAGTGKTFTIGALVTRYVVEGIARLDEMLVITFGRAASQELRDRVRAQLVEAERAFAVAQAGGEPATDSTFLRQLLDVDAAEVVVRRRRLRDALAAFDAATIATTHQFCQLVLRSLGVAGDTDAGATLVESLDELVVEVVDDVYLRWFGDSQQKPPFGRADALGLARTAVDDPQAAIAPAAAEDPVASARVAFACEVRVEVERRKRRLGILSYDDLLSRLADALADEDAPARARMRQRWRIVLVDEFQDTDPVQWQVLERAFGDTARPTRAEDGPDGDAPHRAMVLIGDPKQAIYAFRGGDVVTYLDAARSADSQATLGTNWRADGPLVERLLAVLRGAALGDPGIVVHDVRAHHQGSRLAGAPHPEPFRLRRVPRDGFRLTRAGLISAGDARRHVAADLAADVAELLGSGATWDGRPVVAGDLAVIVAIRDHGLLVQRALQERGIPAVMAGGGDVFLTPAGDDWLTLLEALDAPHRSNLVRAAALTCFFGRTGAELDAGGEALTAQIADTLRGWALLLRGRGVAALGEAAEAHRGSSAVGEGRAGGVSRPSGLTGRVLGQTDGERLLTDVRHLGQLLHELAVRESLGLPGLLEWFRDERRRTAASERPRRLDSDAAAVQIVTIHGSKGLQYPIVYLPFGYDCFVRDPDVARFHDADGRRTIDVTGTGASWSDHARRHRAEELGEELRDTYVALTRAQSQVVAWWAPTSNTATGGLHRLLFGRRPGDAVVPESQAVGDDEYAERVLGLIEELGGPAAEVARPADVVAAVAAAPAGELTARRFHRHVDTEWRRTSYSGLIRVEEAAPGSAGSVGSVGSEPEETGKDDEPVASLVEPASAASGVETNTVASQVEPASAASGVETNPVDSVGLDTPSPSGSGGSTGEVALVEPARSLVEGDASLVEPASAASGVETNTVVSPMAELPTGATFGSLVHAVLEHADPEAPDLRAEILTHVREQLRWWPVDAGAEEIAEALLPLQHTPLGPLAAGLSLAEIPLRDRLRELDFEFPLAGGDLRGPGAPDVRLRDLAPLLRAHLPHEDPLRSYAERLEQPPLGEQALRGYLSGSVDAVLRLPATDEAPGRFVVVDYKTNFLGATAADYTQDLLAEAMLHSHYPLQALLYSVVLHRFLRWRLLDYDPAVHLGGVLYLYVRGLCGPQTPVVDGHPTGAFSWQPPAGLVVALSDLLDGTLLAAAAPDPEARR